MGAYLPCSQATPARSPDALSDWYERGVQQSGDLLAPLRLDRVEGSLVSTSGTIRHLFVPREPLCTGPVWRWHHSVGLVALPLPGQRTVWLVLFDVPSIWARGRAVLEKTWMLGPSSMLFGDILSARSTKAPRSRQPFSEIVVKNSRFALYVPFSIFNSTFGFECSVCASPGHDSLTYKKQSQS